jgi:hypothetical protein
MTQLTSPGALNGFADEVAERVTASETGPFVIFGPRWAQDNEGADPPPDELSAPVWAPDRGWMEKGSAPIHKSDGGVLAMYAPDGMDELNISE